ncbi:MAG TPA: glycosyl transferase family 1 [Cyanobacteria bacterium UBA11369]|nr:glycosyl transferase family 1 [Cyanobacteria bacterium UBA11371]HBE31758.1 glycosyl transferase family 1 [Cyanobacteria bacterium UBA11368]HBE51962.1 glycosyl transferase family 1 [Cyanobacteria bacterium UBA11369]
MNVTVILEHRFVQTPDGAVWTQTMFAYPFWQRYLEVFDRVKVVARILPVASPPPDWIRADGAGVSFIAVPYYIGPEQYVLKAFSVKQAVRNAVAFNDAVILRVSSQLASDVYPFLRRTRHPYGVEVVADPYDAFAPGSVKHPLRPLLRWWFPRQLRRICAGAIAAAYVTERALQQRYPPAKEAFSTHYSSVELPVEAFVTAPRSPTSEMQSLTLITVGTMDQLYKAPDVLLYAVAACVRGGLDLKLVLLGDGKYRGELESLAAKLDLGERVQFLGDVTAGEAVRTQLDRADLFVLPSHQEGLPRAAIEAMARSLPCIGSTVGGFPELLPPEDLVPPGNVPALASKIREVVTDPARMARMSARNWEKSKQYRDELLQKRRIAFYRYIRETTGAWLKQKTQTCRTYANKPGFYDKKPGF